MVDGSRFYAEYHGHPLLDLATIVAHAADRPIIYLAGDSSMDNKHWFFDGWSTKEEQMESNSRKYDAFIGKAINGYEEILAQKRMVKDICYFVNKEAVARNLDAICVNAAVEESTVGERTSSASGLLPHDEFIRDNVTAKDVVVLSIGGNDVALKPTAATVASVFALTRTPLWLMKFLGPWSPGWGHLERLFHDQIEAMITRLVDTPTPPKQVVVCMIYFLDQTPGNSWADDVLARLGYDQDPQKLQYIIEKLYERIAARCFDAGNGSTVVTPFPLFKVLDGKDTKDYEQRVEPSVQGGKKIGKAFMDLLYADKADSESNI
jgi:hypothetical protein